MYRQRDQRRLTLRQLHQTHPVGEPASGRPGDLTGQPGLAHPRPGHRHHRCLPSGPAASSSSPARPTKLVSAGTNPVHAASSRDRRIRRQVTCGPRRSPVPVWRCRLSRPGKSSAIAAAPRVFSPTLPVTQRVAIYRCCPLPTASPSGVRGVGVAASPMWRRWCGRSVLALGRLILPGLTRAHAAMGRQPKGPATRR